MARDGLSDRPADSTDRTASTLFCPTCRYNLTGLPENRCPECGAAFDPVELARFYSDEIVATLPWEQKPSWASFFATWKIAATRPGEMARALGQRHDSVLGWTYSVACYVVASGLFAAIVLFGLRIDAWFIDAWFVVVVAVLSAVAAFWTCEAALAAALALVARPLNRRRRYHYWRNVMHYTSGFTLMTGAWGGVFLMAEGNQGAEGIVDLLALAAFAWWSVALGRAVCVACESTAGRIAGCLAVPLVGAGAICCGYVYGWLVVGMMFWMGR